MKKKKKEEEEEEERKYRGQTEVRSTGFFPRRLIFIPSAHMAAPNHLKCSLWCRHACIQNTHKHKKINLKRKHIQVW